MVAHFINSAYTHSPDYSALSCSSAESRYRNVYRAGRNADGVVVWAAKVKIGGVLRALPGGRSTDPRVCARRVAAWYLERFGPNWQSVLFARKKNPFLIRGNPDGPGYYAVVWIEGKRHEVVRLVRVPVRRAPVPAGRYYRRPSWSAPIAEGGSGVCERWERCPNDLVIFHSRAEALRGLRLYASRLCGTMAAVMLYRAA